MTSQVAELRILGHTELAPAGQQTGGAVLRQPKRLALLAYLALAASEGFRRRDQIVATFWPEQDQLHARTQLRKALHALRSLLGSDAFPGRGDEEISLDTKKVWCDAVAFRSHCDAREWQAALRLYRGDLLEGLHPGGVGEAFENWLVEQRASLRELAARAAWECSTAADLAGNRDEAIATARRAVELNPDDEEGMRRLIAALDRYGDRAGALRVFSAWRSRLEKEFGAEPAPETRKLIRRVQAQRKGESTETAETHRVPPRGMIAEGPSPPGGAPSETTDVDVGRSASPGDGNPIPAVRRRWRGTVMWIAAAAMAAVAIATALPKQGPETSTRATVAVLPLRALGDTSVRFIGEAIAEELTNALARTAAFSVRVAGGQWPQGDNEGLRLLGRRLAVDHLVVGTVQRDAARMRVTLRLVGVEDGITRWARTFEASISDLLDVQSRIAAESAMELAPLLGQGTAPSPPAGR